MIEVRISCNELAGLSKFDSNAYILKKLRDAGIPVLTNPLSNEFSGLSRGRISRTEKYGSVQHAASGIPYCLVFVWSDNKHERLYQND